MKETRRARSPGTQSQWENPQGYQGRQHAQRAQVRRRLQSAQAYETKRRETCWRAGQSRAEERSRTGASKSRGEVKKEGKRQRNERNKRQTPTTDDSTAAGNRHEQHLTSNAKKAVTSRSEAAECWKPAGRIYPAPVPPRAYTTGRAGDQGIASRHATPTHS